MIQRYSGIEKEREEEASRQWQWQWWWNGRVVRSTNSEERSVGVGEQTVPNPSQPSALELIGVNQL